MMQSFRTPGLLLLTILSLLVHVSFSQSVLFTVTGKVTADHGGVLPGVSIVLKGTSTGTTTNSEGTYQLPIPDGNSILIFSYIGYMPQEVAVTNRTQLDIVLTTDNKTLNEVVVVGYGEQQRKFLSTAISSVSGSQLKEISVANPAQALAGQVAGVNIAQAGGQPGSAPVIRIRGIGSLGAGNSPLYVVDGYPLASADNFNQINPGDIQSIEVLKDAAAAAIYGSRGGNGVIIVTTKRGKEGQTRINYHGYTGFQQLPKEISMMNNPQFIAFSKESAVNAGLNYYAFYDNPPANLPYTDWQKEIFRTAAMTQHELSASGGTEKFRFNVSGAYLKQDGILRSTGYERFTLRANLDAQLTSRVKFGLNLAPSLTNTQYQTVAGTNDASVISAGNDPITFALQTPGVFPVKLPNGDYANTLNYPLTQGANSISPNFRGPTAALDLYQDRGSNPRFLGNSFVEWEIIDGLKAKTSFGMEFINETRQQFSPATLPSGNAPSANLSNPLAAGIAAAKRVGSTSNWLWENTITYTKTVAKDHSFALLAGYSAQSAVANSNVISGVTGTFINDLVQNVSGAGQTISTNTYSKNTLVSALGRINYSFKDRYIVSAAIRRDGSSRFGTNNRYALFPSASVAWRVTEEPFLQRLSSISELKIRGSYGLTGNYNIGDYSAQSYATQYNYDFGAGLGTRAYGYAASNIANTGLTWETNKQVDLGFELGLFHDRIYFTADAYYRITTDLLNNRNVPAIVGTAATIVQNIGQIQNKGLEFVLTTQNITGAFNWKTNANISFNRNKVVSLVNANPIYYSAGGFNNYVIVVAGQPLGEFYGYRQTGVFKNQEEVNAGPQWANGGSKPGDIKYEDINKDGKIDANDMTYLGNPIPNFTYGLTNTFSYKGFDLNVIVQGSQGNKIAAQWLRAGYYFNGNANSISDVANRWESPDNPGNGWQPRATITSSGGSNNFSTRYIYDASFLRIRTVTLGYTLPKGLTNKLKLQNIRIYASGQNLFTFTKYIGYNPEANDNGNTTSPTYGYDASAYPLARTITAGLLIGL
ncbi:SusC/RagA family TonB-linked outer membrane protein [Spirosoma sp. HMF4905]|uniref:SusC/RagA family TonB-linked outer membrane protein n=1 Tax=Spirosoma arboris TaxID=2682092 RepID=A0A7K1SHV5_9BACT|nr:TonB-dependent receptor [Spirosoma arboris]MVM33176.1 SusC/RagA family TonB-linked outer membrane protein [Spirosoma arboris]